MKITDYSILDNIDEGGDFIIETGEGTKRLSWSTIKDKLQAMIDSNLANYDPDEILNKFYPVGSIYVAYNSKSPGSLFGGSWSRISGMFLRAIVDGESVNTQPLGSNSATITTAQMPSHTHSIKITNSGQEDSSYGATQESSKPAFGGRFLLSGGDATKGTTFTSTSAGSSSSFDKRPAYQNVYVWRRTA